MVDLHLISTFLEVAKAGNLNIAARRFNITQPALSHRVRMLEEQVGKDLFYRKKTGMELNPAGVELLAICENLGRNIESVDSWIAGQKGYIGGELTISIIPGLISSYLPKFLKSFLKKYPTIKVDLRQNVTAITEEDVLAGNADFGIIVGNCRKPSLKVQKLFENNSILMVCSPDYPAAGEKRITAGGLKKFDIIWPADKRSRTIERICRKLGITNQQELGYIRLPDMLSSKDYALKGLGIAFIAKMYICDELKKGNLVALPGFNLKSSGHLISRNVKYESPARTVFKEELVKFFRKLDEKWSD